MELTNQQTLATLKQLLAASKDGESGYNTAMQAMEDGGLKDLFQSKMQQRAQFATELLAAVHRLETAQDKHGTTAGMLHRGWIKSKTALTGHHASTLLAECERGEYMALQEYEQALQLPLPKEVLALVSKQCAKVKESYEQVHQLKAVSVLHHLIAACRDGEHGFRRAVGEVKESELKVLFDGYAKQRAQFAEELLTELHKLGDPTGQGGTFTGWFHRNWMSTKALFTGHGQGSILAECERGENHALKYYDEALQAVLPVEVRSLVEKQRGQIQDARTYLQNRTVTPTKA